MRNVKINNEHISIRLRCLTAHRMWMDFKGRILLKREDLNEK